MPDPIYVKEAFARIADRYVMTNHVLSLGVDVWWRRVVTKRIKSLNPAKVLDVASGTGDLALSIQDALPNATVIATDFCAEMLGHASSASTQVYTSLDFQRLAQVYDAAHPRAKKQSGR